MVKARTSVQELVGMIERGDFWIITSNKQLNFIQYMKALLKQMVSYLKVETRTDKVPTLSGKRL